MIIERVHFQGFGRFQDQTIQFQPGLNVIQAPNESGKSTLLQGIFALMYGGVQEGRRVRREADWYAGYRPWIAQQYGGEIDYTLQNTSYRLVRNLIKGREQEQLWNRLTGEELHHHFSFDQRKERKIIETQLGLSGELFQRTAYIASYSDTGSLSYKQEKKWQLKLTEKLNSLLDQGDEVELTSVLGYLDEQLNEMGKTENAKQKPFGMLIEKQQKLSEELEKEQETQAEYLQTRVDLQKLWREKEQLEQEYQVLSVQHQRISIALQCKAEWYRLDKINAALEEWEVANRKQIALQDKIYQLEEKKKLLEPPFRMQMEDLEECNGLHYQHQTFEKRIAQLEHQIHEEEQMSPPTSPWWKPVYPFLTYIALFLTGSSLFYSTILGFVLGTTTFLLYTVSKVIQEWNRKHHNQSRLWSIQTNRKLLEQYQLEHKVCKERLEWWQKRVGTNDPFIIRKWWDQTQQVEKIEWELDSLTREQPILKKGEGKYLRQKWEDGKRELITKYKGAFCDITDKQVDSESLVLSRETVHKSMQLNSMQIGEKQNSLQELESRLKEIEQLHMEWEQVSSELQRVKEEKEAIRVAQEVLQEAYRSRQGNVAPILQQISSSWITTVTNNRYDCLFADFTGDGLSARIPETGRKEKIDQLSTGTLMQMVFALKMSIVQYISSESNQQLPILLDDCFVYYDSDRLASILPLIGKLSQTHQILLCTCQTREMEQLNQLRQTYHAVSLIS
jgi:DNA repair exonuclease SbcCD ATPase subunit